MAAARPRKRLDAPGILTSAMRMRRVLLVAAIVLSLCTGCARHAGKPEHAPKSTPVQFTELGPWKQGEPMDDIAKGSWWEAFGDESLNRLQEQAAGANLRLQAALARVDQARAVAGYTTAAELPTLDIAADLSRSRVSGNRPDQPDKVPNNRDYSAGRFRVPLQASYEIDLWGKLRGQTEAARARYEASVAAYHTMQLSLQAELAQTYFNLRAADEDMSIIALSLELRQRARDLILVRKRGGLASDLDVERIEAELAATQAESWAAARRRREFEHALAVLVGTAPENFSLSEAHYQPRPPAIPVGLPADLLQRRPDIAEAERVMAARSEELGVAKAAWFPSIKLTGAFGYESSYLEDLLRPESMIWTLAASLVQPLFEGGRRQANQDRARAAYAESFALYRERLLVAFQEVENSLGGLRLLSYQHESLQRAVLAAQKAERLASARYKAGLVAVLDVIDAQRTQLQAQLRLLSVRNQQLQASVALIRALGGGWDSRK